MLSEALTLSAIIALTSGYEQDDKVRIPKLADLAKPAGRIAMYGATLGAFNSGVPAKIFWKQLDILGSTMGNDEEFAEMLAFINEHKIVPVVDEIFELAEAQNALEKMSGGKQFGKIVLKIG